MNNKIEYVNKEQVKDIKWYIDEATNEGVLQVKFFEGVTPKSEKPLVYTGEVVKIHNSKQGGIIGLDVYIY